METKIPILNPKELTKHHFGDTEWKMDIDHSHHLFHINRLEDIVNKIRFPLQPHRKTVYDFIFLTNGSSTRSKGLEQYQIEKESFFFLPAYQISTHEFMSTDAKGFFCHFDAEIFNKYFPHHTFFEDFSFLHFSGNPIVKVNERLLKDVTFIIERLEYEYINNETKHFDLITTYLLALFTELKQVTKPIDVTKKNAALKITESYKNLLSQYIYKKQRVVDYASMLSITPDHLNKCVKATIGKSSQELIAEMLLLEAKVLLKQTDLTISEIGFKLSEMNPSDFSRFFKSKTGLTPRQFKQMSDFA